MEQVTYNKLFVVELIFIGAWRIPSLCIVGN